MPDVLLHITVGYKGGQLALKLLDQLKPMTVLKQSSCKSGYNIHVASK